MPSTETDARFKSQTSRGRSLTIRDRTVNEDLQFICSSYRIELNQLKGKRLMIIGGTGFVGKHIVESVLELKSKSREKCNVLPPVRFRRCQKEMLSAHLPIDSSDRRYLLIMTSS
jgi:hypothetical protein